MIGDLIRAAIRTCDAATRAFEAMADAYDDASAAWKASEVHWDMATREKVSASESHKAFMAAEDARRQSYSVELFAKTFTEGER